MGKAATLPARLDSSDVLEPDTHMHACVNGMQHVTRDFCGKNRVRAWPARC